MSVSPDEGMQLLQQRLAARDALNGADLSQPEPSGIEGAAGLGIMVRLASAMEQSNALARQKMAADRMAWERSHLIEIPPNQSSAAGTLDDPDRWGPRQGFGWRVLGITFTLASGATQFSVWLDSPNDPTNLVLQSATSGRWEPAHFFMLPGRRLVYTSVGGGLTVSKGNAFEFDIDAIPQVIA